MQTFLFVCASIMLLFHLMNSIWANNFKDFYVRMSDSKGKFHWLKGSIFGEDSEPYVQAWCFITVLNFLWVPTAMFFDGWRTLVIVATVLSYTTIAFVATSKREHWTLLFRTYHLACSLLYSIALTAIYNKG